MRGRYDADDSADRWSRSDWWGVVLDAADAEALADFYASALGWQIASRTPEFCTMAPRDGVAYIATQTVPDYQPPQWPNAGGAQQMMMHLDFEVTDLDAAVAHAQELGGTLAAFQPQANVRVLRDPAGHPFCLYRDDDYRQD